MQYKTVRKAQKIVIFMIIILLLMFLTGVIAGVYIYLSEQDTAGWFIILASSIFLIGGYFLYLQSFAWYTGYFLDKDSFTLRGVYTRKQLLYSQVDSVGIIPKEEIRKLLDEPMIDATQKGNAGDIKGWYQANKRYSEMIKFCTIQFVQHSEGASALSEKYLGTKGIIDLVMLKLKSGEIYLLSPVEQNKFVSELNQHISSINL